MRALLVDDQRLARRHMQRLLSSYPDIHVVGEADHVQQAAKLVQALKPDVVFLDVQMPLENGFALFEHCDVNGQMVFVTA